MSIRVRVQDILKRFKHFDTWEDRYRQLIHYGKKLPPLDDQFKTKDLLVPGCLSKVWLHHTFEEGKIFFRADSDAAITKGIIGILLYIYSDATPKEILQTSTDFLQEIGLDEHLSLNRRNGLTNMAQLIQSYASCHLGP